MKRFFRDLGQFWDYMRYSASAQLRAELANSWLGGLWWVLEPTLSMLVYLFVFTVVFQRNTTYVIAFIVVGLSYWRFFNNCVTGSITLVKRHRAVISKVYIPKFVLLGSMMLVNAFKLLCAYVPIIALMFYYQVPLTWHMFSIIPITMLLFLLTCGVSCWFMHIGVYVEDMNKLITIVLQLVFYISGVFFPINELLEPSVAQTIFTFNPMALIIYESRNALLYGIESQWGLLGGVAAVAIIISVWGVSMLYKRESQYIKVV